MFERNQQHPTAIPKKVPTVYCKIVLTCFNKDTVWLFPESPLLRPTYIRDTITSQFKFKAEEPTTSSSFFKFGGLETDLSTKGGDS